MGKLNDIRWWEWFCVGIILASMFLACASIVSHESVTADEIIHITAGLSYLQRHDARLNVEHPPLMKIVAALPLFLSSAKAAYGDPSWESPNDANFGVASIASWGRDGERIVNLARLPMIVITSLLGLCVFIMSRALSGAGGGFLSLGVFATTPFFLAYGPLVLTDIGLALFALLAVWNFSRLWERPDLRAAVMFGLSLSAALLTKFSAGLLLPIFFLLGAWYVVRPISTAIDIKKAVGLSLAGVLIASGVVYVAYAAIFSRTDTSQLLAYRFSRSIRPIEGMNRIADLLKTHPAVQTVVFPAVLYVLGTGSTLRALRRPTYLLGTVYPSGTPWYFPTLFAYKMTLGFLCLVAVLALLLLLKRMTPRNVPEHSGDANFQLRAVVVLFLVFTAASLVSPLNIGIRHLSVPIAAMTVLLGLIVPWSKLIAGVGVKRIIFAVVMISLFASISSAVAAFPNFLSYFNEFALGRRRYQIAVDSNLDWGQSLVSVRAFMHDHEIQSIALDVRGSVPNVYIPNVQEFKCEDGIANNAEWLAVGASRFVTGTNLAIDPTKTLGRCDYLFGYRNWALNGGAAYIFKRDRQSGIPSER